MLARVIFAPEARGRALSRFNIRTEPPATMLSTTCSPCFTCSSLVKSASNQVLPSSPMVLELSVPSTMLMMPS